MCNWGYFAYDFAVSRITSYLHVFLVNTFVLNFYINVLPKNGFCCFISDQNKNITCLKYTGQVLFIDFWEPKQSSEKSS